MSDELVFYHNPMSRGQIAHWMLEEVGVPYRTELLSFERAEHKKAEYLKINPMGKIPTIVHRGVVVTEAAAICCYLADAFPAARLAPSIEDPRRGTYYRWLFFGAGCIEPAMIDKAYPRSASAPKSSVAWGSYDDVLNALEKAFAQGPFILGEQFSAADVYIGAQLGWGLMTKSIEPRASFLAYVARVQDRPAHKRVTEQSKELMGRLNAAR